MRARVRPQIAPSLCIADGGCRECVIACPYDLLSVSAGVVKVALTSPCEPFWACFHVCPMGAITMETMEAGSESPGGFESPDHRR